MHIAMLGSFPPLRGISSYCFELARSIAGDEFRVEFISFEKIYPRFLYPGKDLKDDISFPAADRPHLNVYRNLAWYNPFGWLKEALRIKPSVLHAQWWSLPLWPVYLCICGFAKLRDVPIVFTVHNVLPHEPSPVFIYLARLLFTFGSHFIVHTHLNRKQLTEFYNIPPAKISVIPHGSLDFQVNVQADRDKIRQELDFHPKHKVILLFGAIRPYKGVDTAIKAFSQVKKIIPPARLLIVGKPWNDWAPYEALIKAQGLKSGKDVITYLQYIQSYEIHRYFCAADLLILPYQKFDSQSGVGATTVSFRKPLIVSDVGGLPELVLSRRAVVPPADPNALAKAIIDCLTNPELLQKMKMDSDFIAQKISWKEISKQTKLVYTKLLQRQDLALPSQRRL